MNNDYFDDEESEDEGFVEACLDAAGAAIAEVPRGIELLSGRQRNWWAKTVVDSDCPVYPEGERLMDIALRILVWECGYDRFDDYDDDINVDRVDGSSVYRIEIQLPDGDPRLASSYRAFHIDMADPPAWLVATAASISRRFAEDTSIGELLDECAPGHPAWDGESEERRTTTP
jgi:hypothetical protein